MTELWLIGLQLAFALLLDRVFAEPRRFHPLVGFGHLANWLEHKSNCYTPLALKARSARIARITGCVCWAILVLPLPLTLYFIDRSAPIWWLLNSLILYLAIGLQSLKLHAMQIYYPLQQGNLCRARYFTGYMVSRETAELSPQGMSRATVESVLENGHDAVIASLFYFVIGGAPLVVLHRLVNTLDAMWGYKSPRFLYFGWWAARADDYLGCLSAYCTSVLYALQAPHKHSPLFFYHLLHYSWQQACRYKSKNGGLCMATGASVLGFRIGGPSRYQGKTINSPVLGQGRPVQQQDIPSSVKLIQRSSWLFALAVIVAGVIFDAFIIIVSKYF